MARWMTNAAHPKSSRVPADPGPTRFAFKVHATDGKARTGEIAMRRGTIRTPAFMPVGTAATVKAMRPAEVRASGADIILGNTYHLMLRPGAERVAALGGVHALSGWERPMLTDSGGYQVMSLSKLAKVSEDGVSFASHLDGSKHMLSPERSMEIQRLLGSDIVMAFDELVPTTTGREEQARAMERSMRWAARSRAGFDAGGEHAARAALFGIQQGALDAELRKASAQALTGIGFDGYAVGGLAVGEGQEAMFACLDHCVDPLPADAPRYLMGVGKPDDIVGAVERGHRHVRLRAADTLGAQRAGLHMDRPAQHPQCPLRRGSRAARCALRLPGLRGFFAGLSAPSGESRRDAGRDADDAA